MLETGTIREIATDSESVVAFRILAEVTREDMTAMSERMNALFDTHDSINMLLLFTTDEGSETGAGFSVETLKAQIRSVAKVERYATVAAPEGAGSMIEVFDKVLPVDARAFSAAEVDAAWAFVGARPMAA